MPLLDHFRPPIQPNHRWESFHSNWATRIADALTLLLPKQFIVEESTHAGGSLEIDVATLEEQQSLSAINGAVAVATPALWTPPKASCTIPTIFPDEFEVRIFDTIGGLKLVGAIELISPSNKDRIKVRQAFAIKCLNYFYRGVSVVIIDIVTERKANLHNETMQLMEAPEESLLGAEVAQYAVAYRPVLRNEVPEIDLWTNTFQVGDSLPTMPLRLTGEHFVPIDFESTYMEACRRRRLI